MLTLTIGQISAAVSISTADKLELEQSGVSKAGTVAQLVAGVVATTAQSLLATSNTTLMSPLQVREAFNASNDAPVYACRAWGIFDGTTTSSSLSGTYTRIVGTTQTVCVATAHGLISGNIQYIDFVTGGASDNTYIVSVVDADTFTVNTVSTSSILSSTISIKRCPILGGGNVSTVTRSAIGQYFVNFRVAMPSRYYSAAVGAQKDDTSLDANFRSTLGNVTYPTASVYCPLFSAYGTTLGGAAGIDFPYISISVFA
jgi:hypothetical protein